MYYYTKIEEDGSRTPLFTVNADSLFEADIIFQNRTGRRVTEWGIMVRWEGIKIDSTRFYVEAIADTAPGAARPGDYMLSGDGWWQLDEADRAWQWVDMELHT